MIVRTCLLISDDPDDHIEFSEALYEVSDDTVLISVADLKRAADLLALKKCVPEFIFLNLGMGELNPDGFIKLLEDPELLRVQVIAYGDSANAFTAKGRISDFLESDVSYSELKSFLEKIMGGGHR